MQKFQQLSNISVNSEDDKSLSILLESIYDKYHLPSYIHPDPLEFLYKYSKTEDREIVALLSASLATGRVNQILKAAQSILEKIPDPHDNLTSLSEQNIKSLFKTFKYRFYDTESITGFMLSVKKILKEYGTLNELFLHSQKKSDNNFIESLSFFADQLNSCSHARYKLLPDPAKGSACKRLNLFLRWMIREDNIDPGGWEGIKKDKLIVPLDTHMMQISTILGFVSRESADMKSALEITDNLKRFDSDDPVRFDFSLTRLGIHPDLNYSELYKQFV